MTLLQALANNVRLNIATHKQRQNMLSYFFHVQKLSENRFSSDIT